MRPSRISVRLAIALGLWLATSSPIFAAVSSAVQWDARTTGSDTNGGGFHVGSSGTDYSQQNTAQIAVADAVTNGTTTITSATANFGGTHVGNVCFISGGTGSIAASWYEVISVTNSTTIVVDRSTGLTSGTGVTLNLGGSLASPGGAAAVLAGANVGASGQYVNIKSGTYTLSSSANVSGGRVNSSLGGIIWRGYNATHGDAGTRPILQAGAGSMTLVTFGSADIVIDNFEFQAGGQTSVTALALNNARCIARNCKATSTATGLTGNGANCLFLNCEASGMTAGSGGIYSTGGGTKYVACVSHGCSVVGFYVNPGDTLVRCISYSNTTSGYQVTTNGGATAIINCLAYGNTGASVHGFELAGITNVSLFGCVAVNNGTSGSAYGFHTTATTAELYNCAAYGNFTANTNGTFLVNSGFVSLTGDPTVNGGAGNFALNSTSGAGAACRAAGWPSSWPGVGSTTGYPDIGPVQHQDIGGPNNIGYIMSPAPDRPSSPNPNLVAPGLILVIALAAAVAWKLIRKPRA